jgi:hypothetical protein
MKRMTNGKELLFEILKAKILMEYNITNLPIEAETVLEAMFTMEDNDNITLEEIYNEFHVWYISLFEDEFINNPLCNRALL